MARRASARRPLHTRYPLGGYGGGAAAYETAHVPGAVHTDYVKDGWRATKGMATGLLPESQHLADLFARCGSLLQVMW